IRLHPLILDYYWKQARSSPNFHDIVAAIATYSSSMTQQQAIGTESFLQWLSLAVRTLFLGGRSEEARRLRSDFVVELKVACIELYQRKEYKLFLRYCDEYLQADASDFEVLLHKARALSRLGKPTEALAILGQLLSSGLGRGRKVRVLFATARTHL